MKQRSTFFWFTLLGFIIGIIFTFLIMNYRCITEAKAGFEAGFHQGIETGEIYVTVLTGLMSTDEFEEVNKLRNKYYSNPTYENALDWHNKMAEILNSK